MWWLIEPLHLSALPAQPAPPHPPPLLSPIKTFLPDLTRPSTPPSATPFPTVASPKTNEDTHTPTTKEEAHRQDGLRDHRPPARQRPPRQRRQDQGKADRGVARLLKGQGDAQLVRLAVHLGPSGLHHCRALREGERKSTNTPHICQSRKTPRARRETHGERATKDKPGN